ncbi:MAG: beta-N-acetylhexosaminidase, partial [Ruminiclostridium sp.]
MRKRENKTKKYLIYIIVVVVLLVVGYVVIQKMVDSGNSANNGNLAPTAQTDKTAQTSQSKSAEDSLPTEISPSTATNSDNTDYIREKISTMSLEEKLGQLVVVGVDGYENDVHSKELIEKYHVGGFILFKKNISDAKQML